MLNTNPTSRKSGVLRLLFVRQLPPAWLLVRLRNPDAIKREALKSKVLEQFAPVRQGIRRGIRNRLIVGTPLVGITQELDAARFVGKQHVLHGMSLFLAAIMRALFSGVLGARNGTLAAVVIKKGDAVVVAGGASGCAPSAANRSSSA